MTGATVIYVDRAVACMHCGDPDATDESIYCPSCEYDLAPIEPVDLPTCGICDVEGHTTAAHERMIARLEADDS